MEIRKLDNKAYQGKEYHTSYTTNGYYDIRFLEDHFSFDYQKFEKPRKFELSDTILSEWLDDPVLYGAFEDEKLIGFVEGFLEKWNNRFRISNICVFESGNRHCGVGSGLMERIIKEAYQSGARMAVLETQSCNERAIAFYRKHGFEVIGFDRYAYTNNDPERNEMRIEMGKTLEVSDDYTVHKIREEDVEKVYHLCLGNPLYYEYCPPMVTLNSVREDLTALPPGKTMDDKYFVGFYEGEELIAVMDLIDGYPTKDIAFIGFFMTDASVQKQGVGSRIMADLLDTLKEVGFQAVRLAWVKGNPQAEHFWKKNGFQMLKETTSNAADSVILAEHKL